MIAKTKLSHRVLSIILCICLLMTYFPVSAMAATDAITTVADPQTLTRPEAIYGDNTVNAGKVTVGKSVSDESITVNGQEITIDGENNFLVTISQSAQVMGLTSESGVPVDVVFVLDTSGSMDDNGRAESMVTAANSAIATLMAANEQNRVAVVAFSSEGYGDGTSGDAAANVLSSLAHYTGAAAESHLQWVTSTGNTTGNGRDYIAGRDTGTITTGNGNNQQTRTVNAFRHGKNGGTNIQAGIAEGAKLLTSVTTTTYTDPESNQTVTRIPFLIILSDGQPTFSYSDETWYAPTVTGQQGPGNSAYEGNGFIAAMTAAYYKGKITEHYYGDNANSNNRCYVYTLGVELDDLTGDEKALAQITLDPKTYTTGDYAAENASSYWNYGNTADGNNNNKNEGYGWKAAWEAYQAGVDFDVRVNSSYNDDTGAWVWTGDGTPQAYRERNSQETYNQWLQWRNDNFTWVQGRMYTFTADSIAASQKYVSSIAYNDQYFNASSVSQMESIFESMVTSIQQKAISVPTKVTSGNHDFDGYVTFTDPIGAYMEVKDMKGVLADGYFYQGVSFAQKLSKYGTDEADAEFDALILDVVSSRMNLTDSVVDVEDFIAKMKASENQAYYKNANDYDNSIVWWGGIYSSDEEDEQVQVLGFADNDTIDYIQAQQAAGTIPEGADYVCRSYFFYGEAGGANPNPDHEYLYFMVRVQRELTAPYRQTVVISAPASLLSMEKVLITETYDDDGNSVYTATVEHQEPARVVYEVGLWDTITPENVSYIVSADYTAKTVNGNGSVNYDAATGTYNFFTNEWDRSQSLDSHHRAQAKATFDAAADNAFYTYQEDTLLVDANGDPVTDDPAGTTAYYVREYYEWSDDAQTDGTYSAIKKSTLIKADIPTDAQLIEKDGKWYIPKGVYTAATLVVNGDDTMKDDPTTETADDGNFTGTSSIVAHPHRTGDSSNSHYTVFLGNNGMLSLVADPYEPSKTISVNLSESAVNIVDDTGKPVKPGDVLTYTVEVKNVLTETADITVTDYVPLGTAFVVGSAGSGTDDTGHTKDTSIVPDANNVLTWVLEDVPAGQTRYVSFQVVVTETALSLETVPGSIDNTATVQIGNTAAVTTNTTSNHPYGKAVTDTNNQNIDGNHGFKVGDVLVYHIRFHNDTDAAADVTVTDQIPAGTTFLSADNGGSYDAGTGIVTWNFEDVAADTAKTVSFRVQINAAAKAAQSGTQPEADEIDLPNTAAIVIEGSPNITLETNTTHNFVDTGDMVITKTVAEGGDTDKSFTIELTESSGLLDGTYVLMRGDERETVTFTQGKASVTIKHGQTLTVKDLPAGTILTVAENVSATPGWTPAYNTQSVTIVKGAATTVSSVSVTNTYALEPLTVTVKGEKVLEGDLPSQTTFGFVAVPDSNNPGNSDPLTGEVTVREAGTYDFTLSPKVFTQTGIYKYTVYEIDGGLEGVEYTATRYELQINVTDKGDGTMDAQATLSTGAAGTAFDLANDKISFTNKYTPADVPLQVVAKKTLMAYNAATGQYEEATLSAGQFRFQIKDAAGNVVTTGTNDAEGKITFNTFYLASSLLDGVQEVQNAKTRELTFVVSEIVPEVAKDPNMRYDEIGDSFTAVLTLADGKLSVSVNGDSDGSVDLSGSVSFTNYANPDSVEIRPVGTKTTGNAPAGVTFSFSVINTENGNEPAAGVGPATGNITFSTMSFTQTGTYTYWIKESNAGNTTNGITYDATWYLMKVVVTRNSYNRLVADVSYYSSAVDGSDNVADYTTAVGTPAFHNEYAAGGYINLTAAKRLNGRTLKEGEFAFKLIRQDTGNEIDGIHDAQGNITFSTLYYSEDDITSGNSAIIHYVMSEVIPETAKLPGVTYDNTKHDVYIRITDDGRGVITAELVQPDGNGGYTATGSTATGITFTNTYAPIEGDEISFQVKKTLTGRELRAGEFDFQLWLGGNVEDIATNDENGIVTFTRNIPATATPGTYTLTVKEATGALAGVSYSDASFTVKVKISDDGKGKLTAQLVDDNGTALPETNGVVDLTSQIVFHNTYTPADAPVQLKATKVLSGRAMEDKEFSFVVREDSATGEIVATGSNSVSGEILFSIFDITAADMADAAVDTATGNKTKTFTYYIMESNNEEPGVTVDPTVFTAEVTVTDDGNGKLSSSVVYKKGTAVTDDPTFQNKYEPKPTQLPLVAYKTLTGKNLASGEFTFLLKDAAGDPVQSVTNDKNGVITFQPLPFDAQMMVDENGDKLMEKTFVYTLSEQAGSVVTMNYDRTEYTIKVTVKDDGKGNLTATAVYTDADGKPVDTLSFVNEYTAPTIELDLEGTKSIVGTDGNALTGSNYPTTDFSFELRSAEGTLLRTVSSDSNGKITFTDLPFSAAGEYRYLISEKATTKPGYTQDATVWCVHITIGYNADTGALYKASEYIHVAPQTHSEVAAQASDDLSFVNVYDPADVDLTLKVKKTLEGRELRENEFVFYIVDDATGLRTAEARNHANGDVNFHLHYAKAGTYDYTIYEYQPAEDAKVGGVSYSTQKYDLTVTVTDDGSGALKAEVGSITVVGTDTVDMTGSLIFLNTYQAKPVDVIVEAQKILEGKALQAQDYTFELVNTDDPTERYTATNTAEGIVKFEPITFTQADTYVYTLREVAGNAKAVTYDPRTYTVTIHVTDDGSGQLSAVTHYTNTEGGTEADPIFLNYYKPDPVTYTPQVKKLYEGGQMGEFEFVLSGEGFESQTKHNDADGIVNFDQLTFYHAGSYTFTIREQADPSVDVIRWDTNVYTLVINVTDDGSGELKIGSTSVTSDTGRNDLVFRNVNKDLITDKDVFLKDDLTVSIDGKQVQKGDILTYTITYKNYTGKAADVKITDTIPGYAAYLEGSADNGGTYADGVITWELKAIAPDASVTVSFCVEVTGETGQIKNEATVVEGVNTYTTNAVTTSITQPDPIPVPENPKTGDYFNVQLWVMLLFVSCGGIITTAVWGRQKKETEES